MFLSAVTLKIRSRSQSPNPGFGMSKCYIPANFGQNPIIRSGYIVHILRHMLTLVLTTTPTPTGIRIEVYASNSNLLWEYMNCHIVFFPFVAQIQGKKI